MPTVTLNRKVLESLLGKKLSVEELKDRIAMIGTDLESVTKDEVTVEVFPNRPDMLSEQGFSRALSSFIGSKPGLREYVVKKSGKKVVVDKSVTMRPYAACAIVKNIHFTDERIREVMQVQEKLAQTHGRGRKKSCYGIYPIDNISFPITYMALDPKKVKFWPLGMKGTIRASDVEELHPTGKKYCHLAKDWKKYPFYIDSKKNVLCMLPYTNSHDTGKVDEKTKNVFIECTGTDLENVQIALHIFCAMFSEMGGEIYSVEMKYPDKKLVTPDFTPRTLSLDGSYVNRRLGLDLNEKELKVLVEKMGFGYSKGEVLIPSYRADILHECDIIEDIAIAYGYEHIEAEIPKVATIGEENPVGRFCSRLKNALVGFGLQEVSNYHLLSFDELMTFMNLKTNAVALENSVVEYSYLRNSIMPNLMKVFSQNQHHEFPQSIFEIGTVFNTDKNAEYEIAEKKSIALGLAGEKVDVTIIRQYLDRILSLLNLEYSVHEKSLGTFIEGRCAEIKIGKKTVAVLGEVHPKVLSSWGIIMPTCLAEIDVEVLYSEVQKQIMN